MSLQKQKSIPLPQELERRILHGLACEWETSLWVLEPPHRKLMRRPLFSLKEMTNRLGYWSSERREICLSRNLVLHHPWNAVREVLRHEIAHQFANEALSADGEPPHGPKFLVACKLLRANPKASGNYSSLHERILHEAPSPEDKIMLRVLHGLDRYSEDLDFSLLKPDESFSLKAYGDALLREISSFGFHVEVDQRALDVWSRDFFRQIIIRIVSI